MHTNIQMHTWFVQHREEAEGKPHGDLQFPHDGLQ